MSAYAFGLRTPRDLLDKLDREIRRLAEAEKASSPNHRLQADHAFNCAITAWHIADWMHAGGLVTKKVNSERLSEYRRELTRDCAELASCRDIANGSKHFKLDKPDKAVLEKTSGQRANSRGVTRPHVRSLTRSVTRPLTGEIVVVWVADVSLRDGGRIKAIKMFERVSTYWSQFLAEASERERSAKT